MTWFYKRHVASPDQRLKIQFLDGREEYLQGPRQVVFSRWRHHSIKVQPVERFVATVDQILEITFLDGRQKRVRGPATIVLDPLEHSDVSVSPLRRYVCGARDIAIVKYKNGEVELVRGPEELIYDVELHQSIEVRPEERYIADSGQYLVEKRQDGVVHHHQGPFELLFEPFVHDSISTKDAVKLAANEAIVVYRRKSEVGDHLSPTHTLSPSKPEVGQAPPVTAAVAESAVEKYSLVDLAAAEATPGHQAGAMHVERRLVRGPAVFMPQSNEWLHKFSWHGSMKNGKGSLTGSPGDRKIPHALNFTVLRCMPDQIYYSVEGARTSDDAHLTVHLMIFFELRAIEQMIDNTNDLIGDILSSASADVMIFAANVTYEEFLRDTAELSCANKTYPILKARMQSIGVELLKVVYRGYSTSAELQKMHEMAIARRTKLRLESDAAREEQATLSMELRCREDRSANQQALEEKTARHKVAMEAIVAEQTRVEKASEHSEQLRRAEELARHGLAQKRAIHDEEVRQARELAVIELEHLRERNDAEVVKCEKLRGLGVDLTQYLSALAAVRPDKHVRIDTAEGVTPNVHLGIDASNGTKIARR